jgi:SAM-dependent methyltransferase
MFRDTNKSLDTRIRANAKFGEFDFNAWLRKYVRIQNGDYVLDVGCGNGNHLEIWSDLVGADGEVAGMDNNPDLLAEAGRKKYTNDNVWLIKEDMDRSSPFPLSDIDWVISNFSIYYSTLYYNVGMDMYYPKAMDNLVSVLHKDGTMVFSGPARGNTPELYEYHRAIGGSQHTEYKSRQRATVIEEQVVPYLQTQFKEVDRHFIDHRLVFPTTHDFLEYFKNGMLYKEDKDEIDHSILEHEAISVVTKQTIVVFAKDKK